MGGELGDVLEAWSGLAARDRFGCSPSNVAPSVRETRGVLVDGATEAQIVAAESRLGVTLPPTYRRFLQVSNGAYGGQLGLQAETARRGRGEGEPIRPTSLLPVEEIGFVAFDDPPAVDGAVQYTTAVQLGQSTLHHPYRGDEVAYLSAPWSKARVFSKRGHAHWSIRIGWASDPAIIMLLNPLVRDAAGEWELIVIQPEEDYRYSSFGAWLDATLERERLSQTSPGRARARLHRVSPASPAAISAVEALIDIEPDIDWLVERVEQGLAPGVRTLFQQRALQLLEWIDVEHGTEHFATWVRRMLDDPLYRDVALLGQVAESPLPGLPSALEINGRHRSGDNRDIAGLPTSDLVAIYDAAPDPMLAEFLAQRAHPRVVDQERVLIEQLAPVHAGYLRAATRVEIAAQAWTEPGIFADGHELGCERIVDLAERYGLDTAAVARSLVRAGYIDDAVDYLETELDDGGEPELLYTIAEINSPRAWEALDRAADDPDEPQSRYAIASLEAAARTDSPLLPLRAVGLLDGTDVIHLTALLALEIQPTRQAADALLDAWRTTNHLGALRALARRRDTRVLDDCLLLLADTEPEVRRLGAETLRDLGQLSSVEALISALTLAETDDLVVILAHALAMLHANRAIPVLRDRAGRTNNAELARLLRRWADQMVVRVSEN